MDQNSDVIAALLPQGGSAAVIAGMVVQKTLRAPTKEASSVDRSHPSSNAGRRKSAKH
jgi:hypothetical protein